MNEFYEFTLRIFDENMSLFCMVVLVTLFCHYFFLRRQIYSIFDPLLMFVVFNSFAIVTVFFVSYFKSNYSAFLDLLAFNFCFFSSCFIFKPINLKKYRHALSLQLNNAEYKFFVVNSIVFIMATCVLWLVRGVPMFSNNPSEAKVVLYQGGFGIVRYIHFILPIYLVFYSALCLLSQNNIRKSIINKSFLIFVFMFSFAFFILSGAKVSFIWVILSLVFINECFPENKFYSKIQKLVVFLFILSIAMMFLIIFLSEQGFGAEVYEKIIFLFGMRMLASGDALYFWYNFDLSNKMESINIVSYILSPLFGMFGISEHAYGLGVVAMNVATGHPLGEFGPNGQLPLVLGLSLDIVRFPGAFLFGLLFFYIRNHSYKLLILFRGGGNILFTLVFFSVIYIYIDIINIISTVYVFLLVFMPIYIFFNIVKFWFKHQKN